MLLVAIAQCNDTINAIDSIKVIGECWKWQGSKSSNGYGIVRWNISDTGKAIQAHRFIYEMVKGKIPDGKVLDHLCKNTDCVNPDHLEPVSQRENILRGEGFAAVQAKKTHCKRGHEFNEANTIITDGKSGYPIRKCRICYEARWRKYYVPKKRAKHYLTKSRSR